MIKVLVWLPGRGDSWGHAALDVTGGAPLGSAYVSWWPKGVHTSKSLSIASELFCATAYTDRTFQDDVRGEDGRRPSYTIELPGKDRQAVGLDETAIKAWWKQLTSTGTAKWCTLTPNCSTVAAYALTIGGGDRFSDMWSSANLIWSPSDVADYARAIQIGIASAQRRRAPVSSTQLDGGLPPGGVK